MCTEFNWTEEQENAFREVKCLVTTTPVLSYYDLKAELEIQCDTSKKGLGAASCKEANQSHTQAER